MRQNPLALSIRGLTTTTNGALAFKTTGNSCLNLFSRVGSMRRESDQLIRDLFYQAAMEDVNVAAAVMLWTRDCRGGSGERRAFKIMAEEFQSWCVDSPDGRQIMKALIDKAVELGRWDDIFIFNRFFDLVVAKVARGVAEDNQLLFKWLPREKSAKKDVAFRLMKEFNMTPRQYRKLCSGVVTTETLMCARKWEDINLSHVPSVASSRYQKAFALKHPKYAEWKAALEAGTAKVNASVSFPHDVWQMTKQSVADEVINATWAALPNYIPEGVSVLPIADTSGSMTCRATESLSCLDISISLGMYIAEKNTGPFQGLLLTFDTHPQFHVLAEKTVARNLRSVSNMPWGGSTNFEASYELILNHAVKVKATQAEMPQYLICLSDMQFNSAVGYSNEFHFENVKKRFAEAGYVAPKLIFWNLNGSHKNYQAEAGTENVILISGFSPSILKNALSGKEVTPVEMMMETVMVDRYALL
jgi:hypothetical protein